MGFIGFGGMARSHLRGMLKANDPFEIVAVCEPDENAYTQGAELLIDHGVTPPPREHDLDTYLRKYSPEMQAVFIITPHVHHFEQARACLEAGLDVLLEKPMVMNVSEAKSLIKARDESGRLLVVAFQGGLSPAIRKASELLRSGECGRLLNISGMVWQNWGPKTIGKWRQDFVVSGGGFMFDTGAHMLNSVCDLAGEDFVEVAAWQDNLGRPVDILTAIMGRLESGGLVTITGCGETIPSCASELWVFCTERIIRTGQWGERLEIQRDREDGFQEIDLPPMEGTWGQFVKVLNGDLPNPCPPEVGLRMAKLWDAVKASSKQGGKPVDCRSL